jgi:predicted nucleic acid-binding protein
VIQKIFVDTNILLDVLTKREPFYHDSAMIWSLCESRELEGYVSIISFNNIFYIARKLEGKEAAYDMMRMIRGVFRPVAMDEQNLQQALDAGFADFEDAIHFHAAIACCAHALVTRNPKDFPAHGPPVLNAAEFLAALRLEG